MAFSSYTSSASLIDDFNRAATGPPPSASWGGGVTGGASTLGFAVNGSNRIARPGAGFASNIYSAAQYGPDVIAFVTVAVSGGDLTVYGRLKDIGAGTVDGYATYYDNTAKTIEVGEYTNGVYATLSSTSASVVSGDKIGLLCVGTQLTAAHWTLSTSTWNDRVVTTDSTVSTSGYVALEGNGTAMQLDDFYVGTIASGTTHALTSSVSAISSFTATAMNSTRGVSASVAGVSQVTAGLAAEFSLAADINAVSSFSATGIQSDIGLSPSVIQAVSSFSATGMVATLNLAAAFDAVSVFTATTLSGVGLELTPVSDPGGLVLTPYSDPGGLTLTPYSDPGGLTLTPVT